jgi:CelD/BcsL family acetyltransferase involved in cellulose biosynthesis
MRAPPRSAQAQARTLGLRWEWLPARAEDARLAAEWQHLYAASPESPFHHWAWISTWLRLLPERVRPRLLRIEGPHGLLALGLIVARKERGWRRLFGRYSLHLQETGEPEFDEITLEYAGLLCPLQSRAAAYAGLLAALEALKLDYRFLKLSASKDGEWLQAALTPGYRAHCPRARPVCRVDLGRAREHCAGYVGLLAKSTRAGLRRTGRAYAALGEVVLERATTASVAMNWLAELELLHTRYWCSKLRPGAFGSPFFSRFQRALLPIGHAAGLVEVQRVRAGDQAVGYLYHLVSGDCAHFYCSGLAYALLEREDRPGFLCGQQAIQHYQQRGLLEYDFMAGEAAYKHMLGTHLQQVEYVELGPRRVLEPSLRRLLRRPPLPALAAGPRLREPIR